MRSVTVRIGALEFSATITAIGEWLHANQYEPLRYKYEDHEDAVLVTVDFTREREAEAFAMRFDHRVLKRLASAENLPSQTISVGSKGSHQQVLGQPFQTRRG